MSIVAWDTRAGYLPEVDILNGVSLEVADREVVTVIGPNGSGKSTLLKTIMGYLVPRQGGVEVDGQPIDAVPVHERALRHGLAYVPQLNNVFGPLTVRENLEVGGQRLDRASRKTRVQEMFDAYPNLGQKASVRSDALSGGERQMLALARALMTRPRHLLLDEPSAGLSPRMMGELFAVISNIREREGVTVLLVEQNAAQSLSISDRGYVLVLGRVALEGPAQYLLKDPEVRKLYLGGAPDASPRP